MKKIKNYWNLLKHDSKTRKSFLLSWVFVYFFILTAVYYVDKYQNNIEYRTFILPIFTSLIVYFIGEVIFNKTVYTKSATEAKKIV